jgi:hypothetical protein
MLKLNDNAGLNPVSRIAPALSVLAVGSPFQAIDARTALFSKEQHPQAANGQMIQTTIADSLKNSLTTANFSPAAHLIDEALKQAEVNGAATRFEAKSVVTHSPKLPAVIAHDLKAAIANSGLFYESHLADYMDGRRSLSEIKQEPQNQGNSAVNGLLSQQLTILENQRLSWHGEVWANQSMDWNIYREDTHESSGGDQYQVPEEESVSSDITLHLPNLGKVTAKLNLKDGRMRIAIFAEDATSLATLKGQSSHLVDAIKNNGQALDALTVKSHD